MGTILLIIIVLLLIGATGSYNEERSGRPRLTLASYPISCLKPSIFAIAIGRWLSFPTTCRTGV